MFEHSHEDKWLNSVKELQIGRIYVFQEDNDPRYKAEDYNKDLTSYQSMENLCQDLNTNGLLMVPVQRDRASTAL